MKRRLLLVAVFLLAGTIVNVAVAWGWALFGPGLTYGPYRQTRVALVDRVCEEQSINCVWLKGRPDRFRGLGYDSSLFYRSDINERLSYWRVGLPVLSVEGIHYEIMSRGQRNDTYTYALPLPFVRRSGMLDILPFGPVWPGFAVNTIFYAAILWLPFVVRRWMRVRRGLCPKCAYPMGESAVCTECGRAIPHRAVA